MKAIGHSILPVILIAFLLFFNQACNEDIIVEPLPIEGKRISAIKIDTNGTRLAELHFIYDDYDRVSKMVRRMNNHDWYIDYYYGENSMHIDEIGGEYEDVNLDSNGYPIKITKSFNRWYSIEYINPGQMSVFKTFVSPSDTLYSSKNYIYDGNQLEQFIKIVPYSYIDTTFLTYSAGDLIQYGDFSISHSGGHVSQINIGNSPNYTHSRLFEFDSLSKLLIGLVETTYYTSGNTTVKSYEFEYEDGKSVFPFFWQSNFYRITAIPDFLPHAWYYGGIM